MNAWLKQRLGTPWRATLASVLAVAVLQLLAAPRIGLGVDEAHYALYGRFPALSYFDHPPMVGWLQWLMLHLGDGPFVLRLMPILLMAASSLALFRLARELYPDRSPWRATLAVLVFQSCIMVHLIGIGMVPDGPLLLFGLLSMIVLARIARGGSGREWLLLGLLLGLCALSKYTAITLALSAALVVAFFGRWRELARPWPWLGAAIALAMCAPILVWNIQNDWISIQYQIGHGTGSLQWSLRKFAVTQLSQAGVYSPGVYLLGWLAIAVALRNRARDSGDRLTLILGLPILLLFAHSGGYSRGLPHWPLLGWAASMPLLVGYAADRWNRTRPLRMLAWFSLGTSVLAIVLLHILVHLPFNPFPPYLNPLRDLVGWDEAATRAVALRREMAEQKPATEPAVLVQRWTHASRLAWYGWPEPMRVLSSRNRQFHIWYGQPTQGENGILVLWGRQGENHEETARKARNLFDECNWIETFTVERGDKPVSNFHFYECLGLKQAD